MEISILLIEQIAELFLMILMGYIIVKTGLLKGDDSKVISKIVLYLVIPCVIINAFQVDYTSEKVKELLLVFAASVLLQVILLAAVWGVGKVLKLNEVEMTSIYYSNSGNLIVPLVTFILGKEWVLYGCVFMSVQLVFLAVITPSASTITQMCQVYGNDSKYASAINVMTTLLSIITMPLMVLLYQTVM